MGKRRTRFVVGCMTGTSMDALDAALVRIDGEGLELQASIVRTASWSLRQLTKLMRPLAAQEPLPAEQFAKLGHMLAVHHAVMLPKLIGSDPVDLVAVHGQTIFHRPPLSWQLIEPATIAQQLKLPVVFNLRAADLATGGHGAPITPIADYLLFRSERESRVVLNLGGFVNFTWLPASRRAPEEQIELVRGGDVCSCNQLLDGLARRVFRKAYDADGGRAAEGTVDEDAIEMLMMMLDGQAAGGRSLGTGDEALDWVSMFRGQSKGPDLARTACSAIARVVARHVGEAQRFIVAGGGCRNLALMQELRDQLDGPVDLSDEHGVPAQYREAVAMALLGALCQDRVPITLPQVTGALERSVAGMWVYP